MNRLLVTAVFFLAAQTSFSQGYGNLPVFFEPNLGQAGPGIEFLAHGPEHVVALTARGLRVAGAQTDFSMRFAAGNPAPRIEGLGRLPGTTNYLKGADPGQWHTGIPQYGRVRYRSLYPGVDAVFYGSGNKVEYDLIVRPGTDPGLIRLSFAGLEALSIDKDGSLVLQSRKGEVRQHKPTVYQIASGRRREIEGRYVLRGAREAAFEIGSYDRGHELVIDPVLFYGTYLGGNNAAGDYGGTGGAQAIAVDTAGNAYVAGSTRMSNFPATPGGIQGKSEGSMCAESFEDPTTPIFFPCSDAFVAKLNPAGTALLYATYLGGNRDDAAYAIAVDAAGNAYVTGKTNSDNFPTTPGAASGPAAGFVAKLNPSGTALVYSTTALGGTGIALDTAGNAYVADDSTVYYPGGVRKLNASGTTVLYSYLTKGHAIAVDGQGNAYVAGADLGNNIGTTPGAFQTTPVNRFTSDAFVFKLNPSGTAPVYATYLSGSGEDYANAIAVDAQGNAYVLGGTTSTDFPVTAGTVQPQLNPYTGIKPDLFVAKLDPSGSKLVYSTYLGGEGTDYGTAIAVDSTGAAYIAGRTDSRHFPTTRGAVQPCLRYTGHSLVDAFVARLNSAGTALLWSTFLGGSEDEEATGLAIDSAGNAYLAGSTRSDDFPVSPGAFQPANGHVLDTVPGAAPPAAAFVAKVAPTDTDQLAPSCVVSAATLAHGPVAPGEVVTVFGAHAGPVQGISGTVTSDRWDTQAAETRVLFDGIPAPVLYTQENQINTIVPYAVAGGSKTSVQVEYRGERSNAVDVPLAPSAPGIFTMTAQGQGQGAIVNEDRTINSETHPAKRNGRIYIYGTGEGMTNPPGQDGKAGDVIPPQPLLAVKVLLCGQEIQPEYAGGVYTQTAGLLQVNVVVPDTPGCRGKLPLQIKVGENLSLAVATVEVQQ